MMKPITQGLFGRILNAAAAVLALLVTLNTSLAAQGDIQVARFSSGDLAGWEAKVFSGETEYRVLPQGDHKHLRAHSKGTASGLFRKIQIDLSKTPYLNWRWKVDNVMQGLDERTRAGDDYPARVYVVVSGGMFFWKTRALNYVWSNNQAVGSAWPNAFTSNAYMVAVQTGTANLGQWREQKRHVRDDFKRYFGSDIITIDAVAIMTDADNSGREATAYYGDIYFSSE